MYVSTPTLQSTSGQLQPKLITAATLLHPFHTNIQPTNKLVIHSLSAAETPQIYTHLRWKRNCSESLKNRYKVNTPFVTYSKHRTISLLKTLLAFRFRNLLTPDILYFTLNSTRYKSDNFHEIRDLVQHTKQPSLLVNHWTSICAPQPKPQWRRYNLTLDLLCVDDCSPALPEVAAM
jgi:hypothetical protein